MAKNIPFNIKISVDGQEMVVKSIRYVKDFGQEIDITRSSAQRLSDSMQSLANTAMAIQGMTGALSQISNAINSVTEESRSFDAAMKAANTMAGKDAAGFKDLKSQVSELSKTIPLTRDELANGLYQVISNGVPENNWIDYLNASSRAAVGGIADVGEVVKVTSTIIKNYGLEWSAAQDIQDKIQLTAKNGVTSFEQLAAALPSVTGQAAQLGVSFTEMLAVMSTLTGVTGNTSEVATQLSSVLTALTKESSKAQKMAAEMGIEFNAASIKAAGGLRNYLAQLDTTIQAYAAKTGELKESIYAKLFGRAEALRLTNALTGELAGKFAENIEQLDKSAGTISKSFGTMSSTIEAKVQMLKNKWGEFTDIIASGVASFQPFLDFGSHIGMTVASIAILTKAFKGLITVQALTTKSAVQNIAVFTLFGRNARKAATALNIMSNAEHSAATRAMALKIAIRGLLAATGIGLAITLISTALYHFIDNADKAADKADRLSRSQETLESVHEEGERAAAEMKVKLEDEKNALADLIKGNKDTADTISRLNSEYGNIFGKHETAAEWYDVLIKKSELYCEQLEAEAEAKAIAAAKAENKAALRKNYRKQEKLRAEGKDKDDSFSLSEALGFEVWRGDSKDMKSAKNEAKELIAERNDLADASEKVNERLKKIQLDMNAPMSPTNKPTAGNGTDKHQFDGTRLIANARTYKELGNNIQFYQKQLDNTDPSEVTKIKRLTELKAATEDAQRAIKELIDEQGIPSELKTLDDFDKKLSYLQNKRKDASKEQIADIDLEIAKTEKLKNIVEMASAVQIDDSRISTYSELNKKREYYNYLVNEGTEDEIKAGRAGLDALDKVQKKLDEIGKVPPPLENLSTLQEYDAAIQFYTDRQQKEDADNIQKTQEEIDRLTKGRDAIQLGMKLPSMQKEVADIMDLPKKEYTIKVRGIGFDGLTDKIRELSKELDNPNLTKSQRQQIEELRDEYKKMRHDAVMSFSTLASGWESVKGIGSSIENLSSAMDDNASAWQKITSVVDAFMQVYNGISEIVGIINMLTEATVVSKTAKEEEAGASVASLAASTAEAGEQSAIAAAKVPVIAANKAATASFVELAAAEYMAAHASIPFAGFAIGSGFTTSMATLVKSMGLMAFAQGGIISGPTLGLIGEYAGASSNPEVVAPLDKLRSLIQTPQVSLPPGSIVGKVQGTDILLVASRASLIHSKSGRKTTIK